MQITLRIENTDTLPTGGPVSFTCKDRGFDIGRHEHLDWCLPDPQRLVSGKHCEIRFTHDQFVLQDVSTNGTYLNDSPRRLEKPYALKNGDRLLIGNYWISVVINDYEPERASSYEPSRQTGFPPAGYKPAPEPYTTPFPSPAQGWAAPEAFPPGPFPPHPPSANSFSGDAFPAGPYPASSSPSGPMAPEAFPEDAFSPQTRPIGGAHWPGYPPGADYSEAPSGRHAPPSLAPGVGTPVDDIWNRQSHAWGTSDPSIYDLDSTQSHPGPRVPLRADPLDHLVEQPVLNRSAPAAAFPANPPPAMPFSPDPFAVTGGDAFSLPAGTTSRFAPPQAPETREPAASVAGPPTAFEPQFAPASDPERAGLMSSSPPAAPLTDPFAEPRASAISHEVAAPAAPPFPVQESRAAAPVVQALPVFDGQAILKAFARGAKIPEKALDGKDPEAFAEQIGEILHLVTGDLMGLLQARSQIKAATRNANLTLIGRTGNNALKFSPTATMALQTMLASEGGEGGYLPIEQAVPAAFKDIKKHHVWTYAAMQKAVVRLEARLSPDAIEAETPAAKRPFANPKAQLWDRMQERWKLLPSSGDGGLLGLFTQYFTECYEELSGDDPETSDR